MSAPKKQGLNVMMCTRELCKVPYSYRMLYIFKALCQKVNISGFAGHTVSAAATHLSCCGTASAVYINGTDNT